nr:unnamed protein product [Callosobruchus chinensis]
MSQERLSDLTVISSEK